MLIVSGFLIFQVNLTGAALPSQELSGSNPRTPITIKLKISRAPRLQEVVLVTCSINSAKDAPRTIASIELPRGAMLVRGRLGWKGMVRSNKPAAFSAKIRFVAPGNWTIRATAIFRLDEQNAWGDADTIYLNVTKKFGRFGFAYPK